MDLVPFEGFVRLLAPLFLTWLAWIVWRTPYQERRNRILAVFLAVVAAGYWLELLWVLVRDDAPWQGPVRDFQLALGNIDPFVLLVFALAYRPRLGRAWRGLLYGVWAVVAFAVWTAQVGSSDLRDPTLAFLLFVYVNGTYLLAFMVLLVTYADESRSYLARQVGFLAAGVGFAALSRSQALFFGGGPAWAVLPAGHGQILAGALLSVVLLLLVTGFFAVRRGRRRSALPVLGALGGVLGAFYVALMGMSFVVELTRFADLRAQFFGLRWVVFALIVGYGILRYQLFDFELRKRQAGALLMAAVVATFVAMVTGAAAADLGLGTLSARLAALLVALALLLPLRALADLMLRRVAPQADTPAAYLTRRLEIYEATLEYALAKPEWTEEERRFVETLREVFDVTPEEHARVVGRLRPPLAG